MEVVARPLGPDVGNLVQIGMLPIHQGCESVNLGKSGRLFDGIKVAAFTELNKRGLEAFCRGSPFHASGTIQHVSVYEAHIFREHDKNGPVELLLKTFCDSIMGNPIMGNSIMGNSIMGNSIMGNSIMGNQIRAILIWGVSPDTALRVCVHI
jgi:hypothetical protein